MQSVGKSVCGDVFLDSVNMASRDVDGILDQLFLDIYFEDLNLKWKIHALSNTGTYKNGYDFSFCLYFYIILLTEFKS